MFKKFFDNNNNQFGVSDDLDPKTICVYPISEYNLEGIKFLINNCEVGYQDNSGVSLATVHTSLWLGEFLNKHYDKISYVTKSPVFEMLKVGDKDIIKKTYRVKLTDFGSEESLDDFFEETKFKTFVLYNIVKVVDLSSMSISYRVRYADITEKYEIRDKKIQSILS